MEYKFKEVRGQAGSRIRGGQVCGFIMVLLYHSTTLWRHPRKAYFKSSVL